MKQSKQTKEITELTDEEFSRRIHKRGKRIFWFVITAIAILQLSVLFHVGYTVVTNEKVSIIHVLPLFLPIPVRKPRHE